MLCIHPAKVDETEGAKRATTDYAVIEALGSRAAWVGLVPIWRTHQLRARMAEIGHPIVGDGKYGGSEVRKTWATARNWAVTSTASCTCALDPLTTRSRKSASP